MADRVEGGAASPEGPPDWICGDCHLGNLGPIASGAGKVEIQIRDLDQAVIGNPLHDLVRSSLSLATAARGSDLPGIVTARMIEQMVEGYGEVLADPVDSKEVVAPIAPAAKGAEMPSEPAERVVAAARALSPFLGERIAAARNVDRSVFARELMPRTLKLEVDQFSTGQAVKAVHYLTFMVGRAHARKMDAETRRNRSAVLDADRRGAIDAPSWPWESVVSFAGSH